MVWRDVKKYLSIPNKLSLKSPITLNPDFPTPIQNIGLLTWRLRGVSELGHLFDDGQIRSFQELRQEFSLPSKDFYKFLQIRHFLELQLKEGNIQFDLTEIEKLLLSSCTLKKKISELYTLLSNIGLSTFDSLRVIWEKDLGSIFSDEEWLSVCSNIYPKSTSISVHEQNYKCIHRIYLTPVRLHRIFPNCSQLCFKCKVDIGTVMHVFWDCDKIKMYWKEIHKITQKIIGKTFVLSPKVYLLNCTVELCLDRDKECVLNFCIYLAKKFILLLWSTAQIPSINMWLSQAATLLPLEKLTYDLHQRSEVFWHIWSSLWNFLEGTQWLCLSKFGL